jgi:anti-anti-sigma factor
MATPLSIGTAPRNGTVVLTATGEIDLSNIHAFTDALDAASSPRAGAMVIVDLSGVEYVDSGAINILFAHADHIDVIANPILMPVLKISGLTDVTSVVSAGPPED